MEIQIKNFKFKVEEDIIFWKDVENWEINTFKVLEKFLNKNNSFIDIGAWNGVLSLYGSKIAKTVYSFEPDKFAYLKLIKNIKINQIKNIKSYSFGAGLNDETVHFFIRNDGDSVSSLIDRDMENYQTKKIVEIETKRMSKFLNQNKIKDIGLIKMDIEGGEIYVLPEMSQYLRKYAPNLLISFHPNWFPNKKDEIENIIFILSEVYDVYNMNLEKINFSIFSDCLYSNEHSFVFLKKS